MLTSMQIAMMFAVIVFLIVNDFITEEVFYVQIAASLLVVSLIIYILRDH